MERCAMRRCGAEGAKRESERSRDTNNRRERDEDREKERKGGREGGRERERERERELQMLNKRIFLILDTIRYSYIIILYISNVDFQFAALSSFTIPISACKASE